MFDRSITFGLLGTGALLDTRCQRVRRGGGGLCSDDRERPHGPVPTRQGEPLPRTSPPPANLLATRNA